MRGTCRPRTIRGRSVVWLAMLFVTLGPPGGLAHPVSVGKAIIAVKEFEVEMALLLNLGEMNARFALDRDGDGVVSWEEVRSRQEEVLAYLEQVAAVTVEGDSLPREIEGFGLAAVPNAVEARFRFRSPVPLENYSIRAHPLTESGEHSRVYGAIEQGGQWYAFAFYPGAEYKGTRLGFVGHAGRFLREGIVHIFTGYDHIAFLAALLLVGGGVFAVLKIVTAFTLAHSLTLSLAALEVIALPSRLVEAGIALSIAAVAAENLWRRAIVPSRWLVAFLFGLIHGFGFAGVLQELHLPTPRILSSLFFFNGGVEVGQVGIVLLIWPLLRLVERSALNAVVVKVASGVILALGLFWLYARVFSPA